MKALALRFMIIMLAVVVSACSSTISEDEMEIAPIIMPVDNVDMDSDAIMVTPTIEEPIAGVEELNRMLADVAGGNTVLFDFDSSAVNLKAQAILKKAANFINSSGAQSVIVEGHCDERGTREYNLALGDRRAVAVKKYLVGLGVNPNKMTTVSYGKERAANAEHNAEAWAQNRRSVLVIK